ncbi:gluconokinase [Yoonia sp. R2331]|uniref:gluconokinase n=1 Tax=Yoonia sp. R2331 TaxID=3237238 RepID=UPI0034E3EB28
MGRFVVMGVSGCGKSTVGQSIAARMGLRFVDGDDLHPAANIAKMSQGIPLEDTDRAPWLADVGKALAGEGGVIVGCSALKVAYRDTIRQFAAHDVHFLHLAAPKAVLAARVNAREGHFMPPALLESQYAALEPLGRDESGHVIDIDQPIDAVLADAEAYVRTIIG